MAAATMSLHFVLQVLRNISAWEQDTDLIVISGDLVSGYAWDHSQGWYAKLWRRIAEVLDDTGLPYAAILGNHDAEADLDRCVVQLLKEVCRFVALKALFYISTGHRPTWMVLMRICCAASEFV